MTHAPRKKVAILGGGMAALATAFELTSPENPRRNDYQVTVYQMGFRLGGKGASGRRAGAEHGARIEEHGLHNLFGFYDNTFRLIRACYEELGRPPGAPFATWQEAFIPHSTAVFLEEIDGEVVPWQIRNPTNRFVPGEGDAYLPLWDTIVLALELVDLNFLQPPSARDRRHAEGLRPELLPLACLLYGALEPIRLARAGGAPAVRALRRHGRELGWAAPIARAIAGVAGAAGRGATALAEPAAAGLLRAARAAAWRALEGEIRGSHEVRRLWIMVNFVSSILLGMIADGVFHDGFDVINDKDFREWLTPHVLPDGGLTLGSVLMRVVYDSSFAYRRGDTRIPAGEAYAPGADYEAGTFLRGLVRANLGYKGAFGWQMAAGTGDVLFAPLFLVLRRRGVRFEFFHRLESLHPAAGGARAIDRIELTRQARIRPDLPGYEPLVDVKGLPCWPSEPLYDQLVLGDQLRRDRVDLESPAATAHDVERVTLVAGRDFDDIVLAVGLGAVPGTCAELLRADERWRRMTERVETTCTQALQVWLRSPPEALGWGCRGRPVTGFWYDEASALNVWADLSHLIEAEDWAPRHGARHVSYFVSPLHEPAEREEPGGAVLRVEAAAEDLLAKHVGRLLWPGAVRSGSTSPWFDWDLLVDGRAAAGEGPARLAAQYLRANTHPSDRYVLSVAGSSRFRLPAHDPGSFPNLYLAGDWTRNGLNCGSMESAVMAGMLAASALGGYPARAAIVGLEP